VKCFKNNFYLSIEGPEILLKLIFTIKKTIIKDHLLSSFFLKITIRFLEHILIYLKKVLMVVNGNKEMGTAFYSNTTAQMLSKN
jgi:hypothetical protein